VHLLTAHPQDIPGVIIHDLRPKPDNRSRLGRYRTLAFNIEAVIKFKTFLTIKQLLAHIEPQVLHLHTLYYPSYLGAFVGFRPLVVMPWNGDILWSPKRSLFHRWAVRFALRRADLVLTNGAIMANRIRGLVGPKKHLESRTGIDLTRFYPRDKDPELLDQLGLRGGPVVLSTRSLGEFYNIDIIIRAIPIVLKEVPQAKFVFVWHAGDELSERMALINSLGIREAVHLCGRVPYEEMPRYFSIADLFLSLSSNDAVPAAVLEGMASGIPPVTADLETVNEWVRDGWNGLVVPQRDVEATAKAILSMVKDRKTARIFVERNLALIKEKANYDQRLEHIESLYYSLALQYKRIDQLTIKEATRES